MGVQNTYRNVTYATKIVGFKPRFYTQYPLCESDKTMETM